MAIFDGILFPVQPILATYCGEPCVEIAVETRCKGADAVCFILIALKTSAINLNYNT